MVAVSFLKLYLRQYLIFYLFYERFLMWVHFFRKGIRLPVKDLPLINEIDLIYTFCDAKIIITLKIVFLFNVCKNVL